MVFNNILRIIRGKTPILLKLPNEWNKDGFHFINIVDRLTNQRFFGYLWATNNWVEIHCFTGLQIRKVLKILDDNFHISTLLDIDGNGIDVPISRQGKYLQANKGFVFSGRVKSFICPRDSVFYATRGNKTTFYSHIFKFRDTVYCNPFNEDMARWIQWHPDDDYKTVFSGATVIGYYYGEIRQGELCLQELWDDQLGQVKYYDPEDCYITFN
jgi:hypothetical protein